MFCGVPDIFSFFGEICAFGARWAIRASTTRPGGPAGAARAFIEVYQGAPPKCASCGAPQLDPATPLHPVSLNVDSRDAERADGTRQPGKTGCRGVAGSSCGAPQEARFGGAPRDSSKNARAAPSGPPGRVVDARIAHRAPNGQISRAHSSFLRRGSAGDRTANTCRGLAGAVIRGEIAAEHVWIDLRNPKVDLLESRVYNSRNVNLPRYAPSPFASPYRHVHTHDGGRTLKRPKNQPIIMFLSNQNNRS